MASVQMNTRIDATLKEQGDATFAKLDYSPSEVVRLVWGFAARNRNNRRAMADFLDSLEDPKAKNTQVEREAHIDGLLQGPALVQQCAQKLGIDLAGARQQTSEEADEQIALALEEDEARIRAEACTE